MSELRIDRGWLEVSTRGNRLGGGRPRIIVDEGGGSSAHGWQVVPGTRCERSLIHRARVAPVELEGFKLEVTLAEGSVTRLLTTPDRDLANALVELVGTELEVPFDWYMPPAQP